VGAWIGPRLLPFGNGTVGSVIPGGFAAYARSDTRKGLAEVLARHTSTPDRCWFGLWEGYGYLHAGGFAWLTEDAKPPRRPRRFRIRLPERKGPKTIRLRLPNRDYMLFIGSVAEGDGWDDGPNLWWPEDRRWCVASEIDLDYTLIGGAQDLCDELVRAGAQPATVDDAL